MGELLKPKALINGHSVPDLAAPKMRKFVCPAGHEMQSPQPWRFPIAPMGNGRTIMSEPCCPICFAHMLGKMFPISEVLDAPAT